MQSVNVTMPMKHLNVDTSEVRAIDILPVMMTTTGNSLGYEAWISFRSCKGNLVVKLSLLCTVTYEYSKSGCRWPNITHDSEYTFL